MGFCPKLSYYQKQKVMKFYLTNIPELSKEDFHKDSQEKLKQLGIRAYFISTFSYWDSRFVVEKNGIIVNQLYLWVH